LNDESEELEEFFEVGKHAPAPMAAAAYSPAYSTSSPVAPHPVNSGGPGAASSSSQQLPWQQREQKVMEQQKDNTKCEVGGWCDPPSVRDLMEDDPPSSPCRYRM
jgi:hypothetical protein